MKSKLAIGLIALFGFAIGVFATGLGPAIWQRHFAPDYVEGPFREQVARNEHMVVLYGTSTCPFCGMARDHLQRNGVAFVDLDLKKDRRARQDMSVLAQKGVPVILIGNRMIRGFNRAAIDDALMAAGIELSPHSAK